MRTLGCACGERLEAEDDEVLFELAREHMDREHPEKGIEGEHVRTSSRPRYTTRNNRNP